MVTRSSVKTVPVRNRKCAHIRNTAHVHRKENINLHKVVSFRNLSSCEIFDQTTIKKTRAKPYSHTPARTLHLSLNACFVRHLIITFARARLWCAHISRPLCAVYVCHFYFACLLVASLPFNSLLDK